MPQKPGERRYIVEQPILVGAVLYNPKVSVIWDIIRDFFEENRCPIDAVFYTNYELMVRALVQGHIDIAWNSPLAWLDAERQLGGACRAIAMRDTDQDRVSHIITKTDSGITSAVSCECTIVPVAKENPLKRRLRLFATCMLALLLVGTGAVGAQLKPEAGPITVGILLLNKPFITEFSGPLDVYHHVPAEKLKVFIVSDTDKEQVTYEGMPFRANYTIDNAPKIDVLVVPSGAGSLDADLKNVRVIEWLKKTAREAKYVTSHCQGAFLLGKAGLLDNKEATTFTTNTEALQQQYPACRVQAGQRIVVDGNLVTSPGGLASYEASLYVVEQLFGKDQALTIASALIFGPSNIEAAAVQR